MRVSEATVSRVLNGRPGVSPATRDTVLPLYADTADITAPVVVRDVSIVDSTYHAVLLSYQRTITNLTLDHVAVTGAASGGLNNMTGYTLTRGPGNSGF
jgi:hypothetical protein